MKWLQKHRILISEIISILFIMLFVYTGFSKLMEGNTFHNNLINSPFAHVKSKAGFISWVIPLLEIIVAILLLFRKTRLKGLYGSLGLMMIFTAYVIGILFFSPYEPCSCGGVIALLSWNQHFIFNIIWVIMAISAIVLLRESSAKAINNYKLK